MKIKFDCVTYSYGITNALDDVSCELAPGTTTLLAGHNGSGKTTFLKLMNGILKPSAGEIWLGEMKTTDFRLSQLAAFCAMSFQNPDDQIFASVVSDEIRFGMENIGGDDSLLGATVRILHLDNVMNANPFELNYATRRMVAIASSVVMNTPVVVFDEPTAGLSLHEKGYLADLIAFLKERGKTIVIATHDLDFLLPWSDSVLMLSRGRIRYLGSRDALFSMRDARSIIRESGIRIPNYVRISKALDISKPCFNAGEIVEGLTSGKGEPAPPTKKDGQRQLEGA